MIKRKKKSCKKQCSWLHLKLVLKYTQKNSSRKSQYHQKWILKALCDILGYFTSSELKQEGIAQVTIKLSSPHTILLNLFGISI